MKNVGELEASGKPLLALAPFGCKVLVTKVNNRPDWQTQRSGIDQKQFEGGRIHTINICAVEETVPGGATGLTAASTTHRPNSSVAATYTYNYIFTRFCRPNTGKYFSFSHALGPLGVHMRNRRQYINTANRNSARRGRTMNKLTGPSHLESLRLLSGVARKNM